MLEIYFGKNSVNEAVDLTNLCRENGFMASCPLPMVPVIHGKNGFRVLVSTDEKGMEELKQLQAQRIAFRWAVSKIMNPMGYDWD